MKRLFIVLLGVFLSFGFNILPFIFQPTMAIGEGIEAGVTQAEDLTAWQSGDVQTNSGGERWYVNASLPVTDNGVLTTWQLFIDNGGVPGEPARLAVIRCSIGGGGAGPALGNCIRIGLGPIQTIIGNGLNTFSLAGSTQLDGTTGNPNGIVVQTGDYIGAYTQDYKIGIDCNGSSTPGGCPGPDYDTQYLANLDTVGEPFTLSDSSRDGTLMVKAWGNTLDQEPLPPSAGIWLLLQLDD